MPHGSKMPAKLDGASKRKAVQNESFAPFEAQLFINDFYSDLLFQPWHCAHVPLRPSWLAGDAVPRRANLTPAAFREQFEIPNQPVILTDVVGPLSCISLACDPLCPV